MKLWDWIFWARAISKPYSWRWYSWWFAHICHAIQRKFCSCLSDCAWFLPYYLLQSTEIYLTWVTFFCMSCIAETCEKEVETFSGPPELGLEPIRIRATHRLKMDWTSLQLMPALIFVIALSHVGVGGKHAGPSPRLPFFCSFSHASNLGDILARGSNSPPRLQRQKSVQGFPQYPTTSCNLSLLFETNFDVCWLTQVLMNIQMPFGAFHESSVTFLKRSPDPSTWLAMDFLID